MALPIPALSIRQPWAWLIVRPDIADSVTRRRDAVRDGELKLIENRNWQTPFRGRFWIHASKTCTQREFNEALAFVHGLDLGIKVPPLEELPRGGIVGAATLTDCIEGSFSPWFTGPFGFELSDPWPCDFRPCKGRLGFFMPEGVPA